MNTLTVKKQTLRWICIATILAVAVMILTCCSPQYYPVPA